MDMPAARAASRTRAVTPDMIQIHICWPPFLSEICCLAVVVNDYTIKIILLWQRGGSRESSMHPFRQLPVSVLQDLFLQLSHCLLQ